MDVFALLLGKLKKILASAWIVLYKLILNVKIMFHDLTGKIMFLENKGRYSISIKFM